MTAAAVCHRSFVGEGQLRGPGVCTGARRWDTPAIPALALAAAPGELGPACSCLPAVFWHEHQENMESQGDGDAAPAFVGFHAHRPGGRCFAP